MNARRLKELEAAIAVRSPLLARKLKPGLSETRIKRSLARERLEGDLEALLQLYSWKNGTLLDRELEEAKLAFFPKANYDFIELERAAADARFIREASDFNPKLSVGIGRYVPVFWNGGTSWLTVDIKMGCHNRIVHLQSDNPQPYKEAYGSFDEFVTDAINANLSDAALRYFQ